MRADGFGGTGRAVPHMEFVDDGLNVLTCCDISDVKSTTDLAVGEPFADQDQDFNFTLAEIRDIARRLASQNMEISGSM